jgi:hypothetical protein
MTACAAFDGSTASDSGAATTAPRTELEITVWPQARRARPLRRWTLRCDPVGGSLPDARNSFSRLTADALRPLAPGTVCTQIYGGPQTARVRGHVGGAPVNARFSRTNGCEIHRWDNVRFLFPVKI